MDHDPAAVESNIPRLSLGLLQRIVVDAASAHTAEDQIARLVSQVKDAMHVEVCSLYQRDEDNLIRMVANIGLSADVTQRIALPLTEGLVGRIATERTVLNLQRASVHPDFKYFSGSGEKHFEAFLGVPIVHLGKTVGVIVVQNRHPHQFSQDEESFLVTIAAQLSGTMQKLPRPTVERSREGERLIEGIPGAPGQAIGRLHLLVEPQTLGLVDAPASLGRRKESKRLKEAIAQAQLEIFSARDRLSTLISDELIAIFNVYAQMLEDDQLTQAAEQKIAAGASAFAAVRASIDELATLFDSIDDEYLQARSEDVRHIGQTLLRILLGESIRSTPGERVLFGTAISITDIARFEVDDIVGIVCMKGSKLSHTAVLARALGIPAVVATGPIDHIHDGDRIVVDGERGRAWLHPRDSTILAYEAAIRDSAQFDEELSVLRDLPAITTDGHRIRLLANTGLLTDITPGKARGAEGIGLYRTEIRFLTEKLFPTEAEQAAVYRQVLESYSPLPVTMRTLDLGGDKQLPYLSVDEDNPALGWRGIRTAGDNPSVLLTQLRAMLRANSDLENLRIMFPMVSTVGEVSSACAMLDTAIRDLHAEDIIAKRPQVGIMVEIPGVIRLLPHLTEWIDFVSVGTNDLVQYLLAVDRSNPRVADCYDHLHPSVIHALAEISDSARSLRLDLSICGEMASDPYAAVLLVGLGYPTFSLNAFNLPKIKALIRAVSVSIAQHCAKEAIKQSDSAQVRELVREALIRLGQSHLLPDLDAAESS
jgi:phosphotransferase system enzyme I (PtsI)/phosphotransferase system enzyme I (PtsP)